MRIRIMCPKNVREREIKSGRYFRVAIKIGS